MNAPSREKFPQFYTLCRHPAKGILRVAQSPAPTVVYPLLDYELTAEEEATPYIRRRMDTPDTAYYSLLALATAATTIANGINGSPGHWTGGFADMWKNDAAYLGLTLLTDEEIAARGLHLRPNAKPIAYRPYNGRQNVPVYIAECHTLLPNLLTT